MVDLANFAFVDELLRQSNRRHTPIIEPYQVGDAFRGLRHLRGLRAIHGQRLLAPDDFSGLRRGNGDLGVERIGRADVDNIDVFAIDYRAPVVRRFVPSPAGGHLLNRLLIATADDFALQREGRIEKMSDLVKGIGMRAAHEAVADHGDVQRSGSHQAPIFPDTDFLDSVNRPAALVQYTVSLRN